MLKKPKGDCRSINDTGIMILRFHVLKQVPITVSWGPQPCDCDLLPPSVPRDKDFTPSEWRGSGPSRGRRGRWQALKQNYHMRGYRTLPLMAILKQLLTIVNKGVIKEEQ